MTDSANCGSVSKGEEIFSREFETSALGRVALLPMIEDSFALALSSRQTTVIENLHCSTHQDVFADVSGDAVRDNFVLLDIESWSPLHLKDHIVPPILSTF